MRQPKKNPLYKSFGYAFEGILTGIRKERNMKIHCLMMGRVSIAGLIFHISRIEWCICLVLFGLILSLELVNTAIKAVVDLVTEERKPLAKIAKDTAAGAVTAEKSKDVLDELWNVAVEEMNFLTEAANLGEFARRNKEVAYVGVGEAS